MMDSFEFEIRTWRPGDVDSVLRHATPNVRKNMSESFPVTREQWMDFVNRAINRSDLFYRAIVIRSEAVGGIGFVRLDELNCMNAEMGYWLSEKYHNQGIMTRVIAEMVDYIYNEWGVMRITATPFVDNLASQRVLENAGFHLEALLEKALFKNGVYRDCFLFTRLRETSD